MLIENLATGEQRTETLEEEVVRLRKENSRLLAKERRLHYCELSRKGALKYRDEAIRVARLLFEWVILYLGDPVDCQVHAEIGEKYLWIKGGRSLRFCQRCSAPFPDYRIVADFENRPGLSIYVCEGCLDERNDMVCHETFDRT